MATATTGQAGNGFCEHGVPVSAGSYCRWCREGGAPAEPVTLTEAERATRRAAIRKGWALTPAQKCMLDLAANGLRGSSGGVEFACSTMSKQSTAKALQSRGLVRIQYIASRLISLHITPAGRVALEGAS